jgi:hypothetical protein
MDKKTARNNMIVAWILVALSILGALGALGYIQFFMNIPR